MSTTADYEWWKVLVQAVGYVGGWIAVVIGWRVTWGHHVRREARKELRDLIDRLVDLTHEIERVSIDLLASDPEKADGTRSLHIRNDISRLSRALSRLKTDREFDCTMEVIALRQSVTGGDFDSKSRRALDCDADALKHISVASLNLVDKMESEYSRLMAAAK